MWKRTGLLLVFVAAMATAVAAHHQWTFNAASGTGGVTKPEVVKALGINNLSMAEAQALEFTCVDEVDGCARTRVINTWVRGSGNGQKVTGFWFVGYGPELSGCGSSAPGTNWAIHVNGVLIP